MKKTITKKKTGKAPKTPSSGGGPSWSQLWIKQEFDKLHKEHDLILAAIKKLIPPSEVNPELAEALIATSKLSKRIDAQVPRQDCSADPLKISLRQTATTKERKK